MIVTNNPVLSKWLLDNGLDALSQLKEFQVDDSAMSINLAAVKQQHPDHSDEDARSRAVYRILTHNQETTVQAMSEQAAPAIPTVVKALNDGLKAQAQVTVVLSTTVSKLEEANKVILNKLDLYHGQEATDHEYADKAIQEVTGLLKSHGAWLMARLDATEALRALRAKRVRNWALLGFAVILALLAFGLIAKADPTDERLRTVEATFLFHPMAQFAGVQPVNLVYNTSSNPLYVSCVGGTCSGGGGGGGTSSTFGAAFPVTGTAAGFIDSGGNMAGANLDAGGRLITTGAGGTFPVTGTFWQATQPVSLTSTTITGTVAVTQSTSPWVISFTAPQHTIVDSGSITANAGTNLNTSLLQLDATGALLNLAQGSTTSMQTGPLVQTATTTAAPTYTTAKTNPLSTDTSGNLRVAGAVTGSGNFTVVQPTGTNLHAVLDTTSTTAVTQATGTNLHAVLDATSTTAVTQATAANLNATIVGTGTLATQAAITAASGSIASGAIASGAVASGAIASGAIASGACAAGCIADGGDVTQGTKTDAKSTATDGTSTSIVSILKEISALEQAPAALPANQSVNLAQVAGGTAITAAVTGSQAVGGCVATNVATPCNPMNLGAQAVSSENSAATTAREVQLVADLVGKLIVLPYANPENFLTGVTAAITDTTSTSVIASAGGSLRNYITSCKVTNSHATVGTFVKILDGATIIDEAFAAPAGGGWSTTYAVPLRGSAATALNCQAVTTGANFMCSCQGYKGL